jgi:hypothetical protein
MMNTFRKDDLLPNLHREGEIMPSLVQRKPEPR